MSLFINTNKNIVDIKNKEKNLSEISNETKNVASFDNETKNDSDIINTQKTGANILLDRYLGEQIDPAYALESASGTLFIGQSFLNQNAIILNNIKFYLDRANNIPVGNLYAKVYAHTGNFGTTSIPLGTAIATSEPVDIKSVGKLIRSWIDFSFSGINRINLEKNTHYCIVVTSDVDNTNVYVYFFWELSNGGNAFYSPDGIDWIYDYPNNVFFEVYGNQPNVEINNVSKS